MRRTRRIRRHGTSKWSSRHWSDGYRRIIGIAVRLLSTSRRMPNWVSSLTSYLYEAGADCSGVSTPECMVSSMHADRLCIDTWYHTRAVRPVCGNQPTTPPLDSGTLHHRRLLPTHAQRDLCVAIGRRRRRWTRGLYKSCVERRDCSGARVPTGTARRRHADRLCTVACCYTHASRPMRRSPDALRPGPYRIQLVTGWWWWI